eukprot:GHVT01010220.1.p1 GENE.GHVT01010220.1~~GHVT01010220.1.p1  ORF type:complete len:212 (+),score=21.49 GHVT01010220.1:905-1540(+)
MGRENVLAPMANHLVANTSGRPCVFLLLRFTSPWLVSSIWAFVILLALAFFLAFFSFFLSSFFSSFFLCFFLCLIELPNGCCARGCRLAASLVAASFPSPVALLLLLLLGDLGVPAWLSKEWSTRACSQGPFQATRSPPSAASSSFPGAIFRASRFRSCSSNRQNSRKPNSSSSLLTEMDQTSVSANTLQTQNVESFYSLLRIDLLLMVVN